MKLRDHFTLVFLLLIFAFTACSEGTTDTAEVVQTSTETESAPTGYDPALAEEVGADEYGMKSYVMAFLKAGPNRDRSPEEAQELQRAHLDNIGRMAAAGQLVLAGPFLDDGALRGIYIFNVATVEEAQALTATDPAIQAGSLVMELHPWYGSAALMKVNDLHTKLSKEDI
ncbi:MAG: YciI family protein [Saprospiraceae bacterium]